MIAITYLALAVLGSLVVARLGPGAGVRLSRVLACLGSGLCLAAFILPQSYSVLAFLVLGTVTCFLAISVALILAIRLPPNSSARRRCLADAVLGITPLLYLAGRALYHR
jgi:hypothetical protein